MFDSSTGPYQAVRLIIFAGGEWRLDSPIYEHRVIASGRFTVPEPSAIPRDLLELAKKFITDKHVLFPGVLGVDDLQSVFRVHSQTVNLFNGPITMVHSKTCKTWHIPNAQNVKSKAEESDARHQRVCGECLIASRYVQEQIQKKREMDSSKRQERQQPSSNYPLNEVPLAQEQNCTIC